LSERPCRGGLDERFEAYLTARWSRTHKWYNFTASPRSKTRVLASLDEKSFHSGTMGGDHPLA
jgi:hypothetical protein